MPDYSIPIVDFNDYRSEEPDRIARFVQTLGASLRDIGFFAVINHGVADALIKDAYAVVKQFYDLPDPIKNRHEVPGLKGQRGFTSFGKEHAKDNQAPDLKEFWHVGRILTDSNPMKGIYPENIWPGEVPAFQSVMQELYGALEACALALLEGCALFVDEDRARFSTIAENGNTILRLINYPPVPDDRHPSSVRASAHEDINLITLLIEATASGLEILNRNDSWIPVITPPNAIIVDAGDMLQNISNGYYKSTTHRVVNPANSREQRFSMPFFVHPRSDVDLSPIPSCITKTGGEQRYPNITAGEYLEKRLIEIGLA